MKPARTVIVASGSDSAIAGVETLLDRARPGVPWNVLGLAAPSDAQMRRADLIIVPAGDGLPDVGTLPVLRAEALPCPSLFRPLPEAPSRTLERVLLVPDRAGLLPAELWDGGVTLAQTLARRAAVTIATRDAAVFLGLPLLNGIPARIVAGETAWLALMTDHHLVVTADAETAKLANAVLKPAILIGQDSGLPFVLRSELGEVEETVGRLQPSVTLPSLFNWKRAGEADWVRTLDEALSRQGI